MPDISLECRAVDYLTDLQEPVTVWRSFVHAQFVTTSPSSPLIYREWKLLFRRPGTPRGERV